MLVGDSHAMHYFPALAPIARARGWRLVVLTKVGCSPMLAVKRGTRSAPTECQRWRQSALRRIARITPRMVIAGGSVNLNAHDTAGNLIRDQGRRMRTLERSYVAFLRRVGDTGARVVVMKDVPRAEHDVPTCVSQNHDWPHRCAFPLPLGHWHEFDIQAARAVGARLVQVTKSICHSGTCRAVIGRTLVYRGGSHLTSRFARSLRPTIARQLPRR